MNKQSLPEKMTMNFIILEIVFVKEAPKSFQYKKINLKKHIFKEASTIFGIMSKKK